MWGRTPICNLNSEMVLGLQEIEMFGAFKRCYLREQLQWRWQASLPREEPSGRGTEGSYRSPDLLCMWAGSHKCSTVLYIPLTCMKWFYGRRRQKTFLESARRSELRPAPWCRKWLGARRAERRWMRPAFDFLSHLSHLSGPEKHLPESRRDHKGHEGQMLSLLHLKFTVNDLFFAVIKRLLALLNWHFNTIKDDFIKVRVGDHFKSF